MQTSEAMHAFFKRAVPVIPELFNMAYAICGNYDLAEYSLQYTLSEAWMGESRGGIRLREDMRRTLKRVAVEEAMAARGEKREMTWDGLNAGGDPALNRLAQENAEVRRLAALRYGCGLSVQKIARLTEMTSARVQEILNRIRQSAEVRLPPKERRRAEAHLIRAVGRSFARPDGEMPAMGAIYRAFQSEAAQTRRPRHLASKVVRKVILAVMAVVCALMFWLTAVLIQPDALETPPQISSEMTPQCHKIGDLREIGAI